MNDKIKQLAHREWAQNLRPWVLGWAISSALCVVVQPFGNDTLSLIGSILYWLGVNGVAVMIMVGLLRTLRGFLDQHYWLSAVLVSVLFSLIFTPSLLMINTAVLPDVTRPLVIAFGTNFAISLLIFVIVGMFKPVHVLDQKDAIVGLHRHLKKYPTGDVWALSAQDHYLEIVTNEGSELILMRLSDAIAMVSGGMQIHRSHWVAGVGIIKFTKSMVTLRNGLELPISRANGTKAASFFPPYLSPRVRPDN